MHMGCSTARHFSQVSNACQTIKPLSGVRVRSAPWWRTSQSENSRRERWTVTSFHCVGADYHVFHARQANFPLAGPLSVVSPRRSCLSHCGTHAECHTLLWRPGESATRCGEVSQEPLAAHHNQASPRFARSVDPQPPDAALRLATSFNAHTQERRESPALACAIPAWQGLPHTRCVIYRCYMHHNVLVQFDPWRQSSRPSQAANPRKILLDPRAPP